MIELALDINEVNAVLNALSLQPFHQVYTLIAKIKQQADPQVSASMEAQGAPNAIA